MTERMRRTQRPIQRRIIVRGTLELQTPTHFGNGDSEAPTDMALQRDSVSSDALLTGSSIAGALRNYLRAREQGDFLPEPIFNAERDEVRAYAEALFGGRKGDDDGLQSPLIVADARAQSPLVELRDGVRIVGSTRTPADNAKYDLELLAAGTCFDLEFMLVIEQDLSPFNEQRLIHGLIVALRALAAGEISLGMKKRRGFGRCTVQAWQVWDFDLRQHDQALAWLAFGRSYDGHSDPLSTTLEDLLATLAPTISPVPDSRRRARIVADFALYGSMLIRAGQDEASEGPDVRHLQALQPGGAMAPVISGTSLAGVLRHQAERILNTIGGQGRLMIDQLFGYTAADRDAPGLASRVIVHEYPVRNAITNMVQSRVSIDRFTGGAYAGALFSEQPLFPTAEARVAFEIELIAPPQQLEESEEVHTTRFHAELGLLLLVFKDLWLSDLPVGGESGIGRGRLVGRDLQLVIGSQVTAQMVAEPGGGITVDEESQRRFNDCVADLHLLLATEVSA